jgi:type IV pilus assembly protein PilE
MRSGMQFSFGRRGREPHAGFTLIELMIAMAVLAILSAIALPVYTDYVKRGRLVEGTNALSALRARMEQYYQDNRTYQSSASLGTTSPCDSTDDGPLDKANDSLTYFELACPTLEDTSYTATVTGKVGTQMAGFVYSIDQDGSMKTTGLPTGWTDSSGSSTNDSCWITRKGGSC